MGRQHDDRPEVRRGPIEPDRDVVAEAAERLLREADRALQELRSEAERASGEVRGAASAAKERIEAESASEDLRGAADAAVRGEREHLAEISGDLAHVHAQLDRINEGIIGLQTHRLRQTGVAALVLAVLIAIAWKVIAG